MNNVLLWLGGLLVALFCALFAVPHFVDWTRYRGVFEEEASRVLGREVRVAGAVNLRLLPTPYVSFEKVRLGDAAGQTGEPFFRADDFTLWLAPGPLLRGAIEAREIELRKPTLKLRLNSAGGGNWQTISIVKGALPFVPSDVALQSVLITDGTISIDGADGKELVRLGAISGELNVNALDGPYRFKGGLDWRGTRHELKLATTAFDAEGGLRMKAQLQRPTADKTTDSFAFDGRLSDVGRQIKLDGQLSGRIVVTPASLGRAPAEASSASSSGAGRLPVDLRATVAADTGAARLSDIGIAFEHDGKPQLVAGSAEIGWRQGLETQSTFSARWIDLDQLLAGKDGAKPLDGLRRLSSALEGMVPQSARGRATVTVDQVTLGGEALSDAYLQVDRDGTSLRLTDFHVNLPGGTRANLTGTLPSADALDGDIALRGANLARFLTWLGYSAAAADARTEGVFALKSKLAFDHQSITVKDAFASLGSAVLTGGVSYKWADRPRLDLVLDGDQIDVGLVSPHALDLLAHAKQLTGVPPATPGTGTTAPVPARFTMDPRNQDVTLRIRAARLLDADRDLRDVDIDAAVLNGRLSLRRMRFLSGTGLEVEAEGDIADVGTRPHGSLRGSVGVADEAAVGELLELFDQPIDGPLFKRARLVAPARVAWTSKFFAEAKEAAAAPAEIWLDGPLLGRRLTAVGRFEGGLRDWRQGNLQLNAAIERPDWQRLRLLMENEGGATPPAAAAAPGNPSRARLQLSAAGRPDQVLSAFLKLEDDAFDAGLAGRVTLGAEAIAAADGELQLRTADLLQAWAVLGLPPRNLPGIALEGAADLAFKDDVLKITPSALEVAGAVVGGEVVVTGVKDRTRQRVDGRLTTSTLNVPRLLDLIVTARGAAPREAEPQIWPDGAFDFSLLDRVEGKLRVEAAEVVLAPELSMLNGVIETELAPGKVTITSLEGDLLGSRLASRWLIEKAPAGAVLNGGGRITGARLDRLARGPGQIGGTAVMSFNVAGRGLAPRSLLSALTGKGQLELAKVDVGAMSPTMVRRLSDEVVSGRREPTVDGVQQGIAAMLANAAPEARLPLGDRRISFDIGDGAVKLQPFAVETADGRAVNRTTIDLAKLMIDSEWSLEQAADKAAPAATDGQSARKAPPLPPVTIVFVGPVSSLGRLDPVVSVDALVRELGVRRMERDVAELERLRRLDEERAKAEAERRKADEAARAAAIAAGAIPALESGAAIPESPAAAPASPTIGAQSATQGMNTLTPASPGSAPAEPASITTRRQNGVSSEPRQVPSSQQLKKSRIQDVFRRQESGGN